MALSLARNWAHGFFATKPRQPQDCPPSASGSPRRRDAQPRQGHPGSLRRRACWVCRFLRRWSLRTCRRWSDGKSWAWARWACRT
eukprot:01386_3